MASAVPASYEELVQQIARLERELALSRQREAAQREGLSVLSTVMDHIPWSIFWKDRQCRYLGANRQFAADAGFENPADVIGKTDHELVWTEQAELYRSDDLQVMESDQPKVDYEEPQDQASGKRSWLRTSKVPLHGPQGEVIGILGMYEDITERKQAEEERLRLKNEQIEAQAATLRELSTPLIPLADGVVVLPLVGAIDAVRAQQIMATLLDGITTLRARVAIIDITGIRIINQNTANSLIHAAHAARLLGTRVVLTGISAEIAQTLVQLQADLGSIITRSTLQSGIAYALTHLK
jgi:rsbT co-antagonist protein RsbR